MKGINDAENSGSLLEHEKGPRRVAPGLLIFFNNAFVGGVYDAVAAA